MVSGRPNGNAARHQRSCTYGYERIAAPGCSDRTIGRRLRAWAARTGEAVHALALASYDRMTGLDLHDLAGQGVNRSGGSPNSPRGTEPPRGFRRPIRQICGR